MVPLVRSACRNPQESAEGIRGDLDTHPNINEPNTKRFHTLQHGLFAATGIDTQKSEVHLPQLRDVRRINLTIVRDNASMHRRISVLKISNFLWPGITFF